MKTHHLYRLLLLFVMIVVPFMPNMTAKTTAQDVQPGIANNFSWNPDGTELAIFADNGVFVYARNFQLLRYRVLDRSLYGSWSPNGEKLRVGNFIWDAITLETLTELPVTPYGWLSDGGQIYSTSGTEIFIYDTTTGSLLRTIPLNFQIEGLVVNSDETQFVSAFSHRVLIIDINSGTTTAEYDLPVDWIHSYRLSPDGTIMVFSASTTVTSGAPGSTPSPLDSEIAILNTISLIDLTTGHIFRTISPLAEPILSFSWNKNIPRIAGITNSGSVYMWDATNLALMNAFSASAPATGALNYSPWGGVLVVGVRSNLDDNNQSTLAQAPTVGSFAHRTIQVIVPESTLENLATIQASCVQQSNGSVGFEIPQSEQGLEDYITQIEAAPTEHLPPGCAADLVAIAHTVGESQ